MSFNNQKLKVEVSVRIQGIGLKCEPVPAEAQELSNVPRLIESMGKSLSECECFFVSPT